MLYIEMGKFIAILFVLLFTPIFAFGAVDLATAEQCQVFNEDNTSCNQKQGCEYISDTKKCRPVAYNYYNSGSGSEKCSNSPLRATYYKDSVGHKKNDCAWTLTCGYGTYWNPYKYKSLENNESNDCCSTCPKGYIPSGRNAQVTYLGYEKKGMGVILPESTINKDCTECTNGRYAYEGKCNFIIVYESNSSIPVDEYTVDSDFLKKNNVRTYSAKTALSDAGEFGYKMTSNGYEFSGWQCFAYEPTASHGDTYKSKSQAESGNVVLLLKGSFIPTSNGFYRCVALYNKPCEKGFYCTDSGKSKCTGGLTTNVENCELDYVNINSCNPGAKSEADCGIDNTVVFKDGKGEFTLPIEEFFNTRL